MTKKLFDILPVGFEASIEGEQNIDIQSICIDSRQASENCLYAALKGLQSDGHDFIAQAVQKGAVCVLCEYIPQPIPGVTFIVSPHVRALWGAALHAFSGHASESLPRGGVTGKNGKTTVATLLYQLFTGLGYRCGLVSTVENRMGDVVVPATHTTPDIVSLHRLIAEMRDQQCAYVFMEVSSHAVDQERIAGLVFEGAIFTNITHDHLDYHGTMKAYIAAKKKFFDFLSADAFALVNVDDRNGKVMIQNTKAKTFTYGLRSMADFKVKVLENSIHGLHVRINEHESFFRMIGLFNAYNIASVYGAAISLGMDPLQVLSVLSALKGAQGRFEQVFSKTTGTCGIVDYAHTPDALENVLQTIVKIKSPGSTVISVVGCGGDRDAAKRPLMAAVAAALSDKVIITSDNPRNEDPEKILDQMEQGLDMKGRGKTIRITDRRQAIKTAVLMASDRDIVLVAGKGHENYQDIKGEKFPFDDKKILEEYLG